MTIFSGNPVLRHYWFALATSSELNAGPIARTLLGEPIVLWRDPEGTALAAPDRCPHREAPLSMGVVESGVLTCAYHGWRFGTAGRCVAIPSAGPDVPTPRPADLPCLAITERYGLAWVALEDPVADIPKILQDEDESFRRINSPVEKWTTSVTRMTDNFLDIAHFPWVHVGTFGKAQDPKVAHIDLEMLEGEFFGYRFSVRAANPLSATVTSGQVEAVVGRDMTTGFQLPFTVQSTIAYSTGLDHIILLLSTPIDDTNSYFTFVVWRNDDFSIPSEDVIAFDRAIGAEDKRMLERVPGVLPMSRTAVVSTQADKCSLEWRRQLISLLEPNSK
jgi:phenylpropionate dioxygenase-like ring-hydroxylating dioxygenase large terminal subunit